MVKNLVRYIYILTSIFTIVSCTNNTYTIKGTIDKSISVDSLYLYNESIEGQNIINRTAVVNRKFKFKGSIDPIQKVVLGNLKIAQSLDIEFILENEVFQVKIENENSYVKGGKINELIYGFHSKPEYIELIKQRTELIAQLFNIDIKNKDLEAKSHQLEQKIDFIDNKIFKLEDAAKDQIITDTKVPAIAKLLAMITCTDYKKYDMKKRHCLLNEYEKELGGHINLISYRKYLEDQEDLMKMEESLAIGNVYKPIKGINLKGKEISIDEFIGKNKYTLLEFWASWCTPCRREIPNLKSAYKKFHNKGFEIYAFSIDENKSLWETALAEENIPWVNVLTQGDAGEKVLNSYGIDGIPASSLITPDGTIVAMNEELRGKALQETLKVLLKK